MLRELRDWSPIGGASCFFSQLLNTYLLGDCNTIDALRNLMVSTFFRTAGLDQYIVTCMTDRRLLKSGRRTFRAPSRRLSESSQLPVSVGKPQQVFPAKQVCDCCSEGERECTARTKCNIQSEQEARVQSKTPVKADLAGDGDGGKSQPSIVQVALRNTGQAQRI
jgi:hypothetical protein